MVHYQQIDTFITYIQSNCNRFFVLSPLKKKLFHQSCAWLLVFHLLRSVPGNCQMYRNTDVLFKKIDFGVKLCSLFSLVCQNLAYLVSSASWYGFCFLPYMIQFVFFVSGIIVKNFIVEI